MAGGSWTDPLKFEKADVAAVDNPKDVIGSTKLPLHLWPESASMLGCLAMLDGALKYGRNNFRVAGIKASVYVSACRRHLAAWMEGEEVDPDSGVPHLSHALATLAIIVEAITQKNLIDDRNYPTYLRDLVNELTPHVKRLQEKHADKAPKHYSLHIK